MRQKTDIKHHCCQKSITLQAVYSKLSFTLCFPDFEQIIKMMEVKGAHAKIQPTLNYKTIEEFN